MTNTNTTRDWVAANIGKYKKTGDREKFTIDCMAANSCTRGNARRIIRKFWPAEQGSGQVSIHSKGENSMRDAVSSSSGVSVDRFIAQFDYEKMLMATIKRLCKSRFYSDADIRSESGIPVVLFRRVAEQPQFNDCRVRDGDKTWWSMPENVKRVREKQKYWGVGGIR